MTAWIIVALLTLSSSIDNLGAGLAYGIRNIRIPFITNMGIALIGFIFSMAGIYFGLWLSSILPGVLPAVLGAIFLFLIGLRIVLLAKSTNDPNITSSIGIGEAIMLGIALSANALTNGVGAGLLGFPPLGISLLAAAGSLICVWGGTALGLRLKNIRIGSYSLGQFGTVISGVLLVAVGISIFF
ncbi:manganese efflux pump [Paenibacillus sp. NPDC058910]|uniref:manganese efflux pump n=1 Tax=unclassified Paenibacillus TaxID=185978 RepID=UPI003683EC2E